MLRKLYDWILQWATTPQAVPALFILSFTESSFFPIPPDVLLLAMCVANPRRGFYYALICSVASVLGGMFGYLLGWQFMDLVGNRIVEFYGFETQFAKIGMWYKEYQAWAVAAAGFTPLPYKVFTLAAGMFEVNFVIFALASLASRSLRFFILAALIYKFGPPVKKFIDKYFNLLAILFFVGLVLGFVVIKFALGK